LIIVIGVCINCIAQKLDTISAFNGTYNCPSNQFKNNNYMRVHFLNDTIFVFTIIMGYNPSENGKIDSGNKELRINGPFSFFGVARLVNYNGVKCWIGIKDFFSTYPDDSSYLSLEDRGDFNVILKNIKNCNTYRENNFEYNVYQFFLKKNQIIMKGICGLNRFFEAGDYHKIDNTKMILAFNSEEINYNDTHKEEISAIVKKATNLTLLPIPESIPDNKQTGSLRPGDKVYLVRRDFMRYTFIVQFDKVNKVTKYGWAPRDMLKK